MTPFTHHKKRLKHGITASTEIILDLCRRWPAPGCTQSELRALAIQEEVASSATIHNSIHALIERDLIEVRPCKYDRRAMRLRVTPAGKRLLGDYKEYEE